MMPVEKIRVIPVLLSRLQSEDCRFADGSVLPMGCVVSYVRQHNGGTLAKALDIWPLVQRCRPEWEAYYEAARSGGPAIWLFSCYMWNVEDNLEVAKRLHELSPDSLFIFGGPHVPKYDEDCKAFFRRHAFVDVAVRAEGEATLVELLESVVERNALHPDFSHVKGISYRFGDDVVRTEDRPRNRDIACYPSPFLTGEFEHDCFKGLPGVVLETNRGCPYGCTFCDWGAATLQKVSQFDLERIKAEIFYIAEKMKPSSLYIADANFGAFQRDLDIVETIVEAKKRFGFPKSFACNYAKNASPRLAEIIKTLNQGGLIATGIISMQSTDAETLNVIQRSNIRNEKYDQLLDIFREEGLRLSSEIMIGLPGQTYESHKKDLQFFFNRKLMVAAFVTSMMPNAPMNDPEYREKYRIVTDENDCVISTSVMSETQYHDMKRLYLAFQFAYILGVLKYFLYFLQAQYQVMALDFIDRLLFDVTDGNEYPLIYKVNTELLEKTDKRREGGMPVLQWETEDAAFLFNHLDDYYGEIIRFTKKVLAIDLPVSEAETIIAVQKAVMPALDKAVPLSVALPHDFVSYFNQIKALRNMDVMPDQFLPLSSFGKGELKVSAIKSQVINNLVLIRIDHHNNAGWELRSPLRFY